MGQERNARWERRTQREILADFRDNKVLYENWIMTARTLERHFRRAVQIVAEVDMSLPNPSTGYNRYQRRREEARQRAILKYQKSMERRITRELLNVRKATGL